MRLIATHGLSVKLAGHLVLHDIDLAVERGEIVTVVGPNGSGKTTLLRALVGAVPLAAGSVERAPDLRIGYVPQRLHLDATLPMTVARFLRLGARRGSGDIGRALEETGVPELAKRQMTALSSGQFQRVLLARALLSAPDLLLLDEPAQGLDQPGIAALYRLVETVRGRLDCGVFDGQPRPACGDGRDRPRDRPERDHLVRGAADDRVFRRRIPGTVRRGRGGRARAPPLRSR